MELLAQIYSSDDDLVVVKGIGIMEDGDFLLDLETIFD
jgi:hypothetical protein